MKSNTINLPNPLVFEPSAKHPISQTNSSETQSAISVLDFNTSTHAGLQPYGTTITIQAKGSDLNKRKPQETPHTSSEIPNARTASIASHGPIIGSQVREVENTGLHLDSHSSSAFSASAIKSNGPRIIGKISDGWNPNYSPGYNRNFRHNEIRHSALNTDNEEPNIKSQGPIITGNVRSGWNPEYSPDYNKNPVLNTDNEAPSTKSRGPIITGNVRDGWNSSYQPK